MLWPRRFCARITSFPVEGTALKYLAAFTYFLAATVVAPALAQTAPATAGGPAWTAFSKFTDATPRYVETIVANELKGGATSLESYRFTWMEPSNAKIEVLDGEQKGSVVAWTGGSQVHAHDGQHPGIVLPFDRTDKSVIDLRGNVVGAAAFSALRTAWAAGGPLTETPGPVINGGPTTIVTMNPDPAKTNGVTRGDLYIAANGAPQRILLYQGTTIVERDDFKDQNLTADVSSRDFSI